MKTQEILQTGFFNISQISRALGMPYPSMLHQKLNKRKANKLTYKDLTGIKGFLELLIKEGEFFNLDDLFHIFSCMHTQSKEDILIKINQYQEKYADIGLIKFYADYIFKNE